MESLLIEQAKLEKKGNLTKTIDDVQKTIDLLTAAREAIAKDGSSQAPTLAKLKRPVKASLDQVNSDTKEIYSALKDYGKALDKVRILDDSVPLAANSCAEAQTANPARLGSRRLVFTPGSHQSRHRYAPPP